MKGIIKGLIGIAVVVTIIGIVSRFTLKPVGGLESRAMIGFAGLLLLYAIALKGIE